MNPLNESELRVLGALVEKQISTPAYYPLTLNALVNACNQKNHRDPVAEFGEATVTRTLDSLRGKNLAFVFEAADARVPKYGNNFSKTYELTPEETAVLCVLILRGPQTPGELRSRTPHLHNFESLALVEETLAKLAARAEPLVAKLPRLPGTKESRYAHLLGGPVSVAEAAPLPASTNAETGPLEKREARDGGDRVAKLEAEIEKLRRELTELKAQFADLKKQRE